MYVPLKYTHIKNTGKVLHNSICLYSALFLGVPLPTPLHYTLQGELGFDRYGQVKVLSIGCHLYLSAYVCKQA